MKKNIVFYDHDDFHYYGIRDIKKLFDEANEEEHYKPILEGKKFISKANLIKITQHLFDC